jgi:hypothetical protein
MNTIRRGSLITLIVALSATLSAAQGKKSAGSGAGASAPSVAAQPPSSTAAFESQMLAYGGLNKIAVALATFENRKRCPQVRNAQESASLPDDMVDSRRR